MTTIRLSLLAALALVWFGAAQAQLPGALNEGMNQLTNTQTSANCGTETDKKDPP